MMTHIVYIEDDPASQEIMHMLVTMCLPELNLTVLADTRDLVQRLTSLPALPDLVFLDITIQPHDGYAALQLLRESELHHTRIVAVTAAVEDTPLIHEAGFDGLLFKPLSHRSFPLQLVRLLEGEEIWDG